MNENWEELQNDNLPTETPKETIERLAKEWSRLITDVRLGDRGDRHHFKDSLIDILPAYKKLLVIAKEIAEENEKLKANDIKDQAIRDADTKSQYFAEPLKALRNDLNNLCFPSAFSPLEVAQRSPYYSENLTTKLLDPSYRGFLALYDKECYLFHRSWWEIKHLGRPEVIVFKGTDGSIRHKLESYIPEITWVLIDRNHGYTKTPFQEYFFITITKIIELRRNKE